MEWSGPLIYDFRIIFFWIGTSLKYFSWNPKSTSVKYQPDIPSFGQGASFQRRVTIFFFQKFVVFFKIIDFYTFQKSGVVPNYSNIIESVVEPIWWAIKTNQIVHIMKLLDSALDLYECRFQADHSY